MLRNATEKVLDAMVEISTGVEKKPQQTNLFEIMETGSSKSEFIQDAAPKKKNTRKKKVATEIGFGSGLNELNQVWRKPQTFAELSVNKKIGYLAHKAYVQVMDSFVSRERADFVASGLGFSEWYSSKKPLLELDYAKWRKRYGWVKGWWNPNPVGDIPKDLDKTLSYLLLFDKG